MSRQSTSSERAEVRSSIHRYLAACDLLESSADILTHRTVGIYAPGYEQRRAERIKERYGIDVPVQSPLEAAS